jgi:phosphoribosylaminoimidazole carboxylase
MLAAEASLLNVPIVILDKGDTAPAKQVVASSEHIDGAFTDPGKIRQLAGNVDVLTVEIEHVGVDVLEEIHNAGKVQVHPSPSTIRTIQDKFRQKEHLLKRECSVGEFFAIENNIESIKSAVERFGSPLMIKSRTLAYDGRGNYVLKDASSAQEALSFLSDRPLYVEKWMPFVKEIAVMVVRSVSGEIRSYPAVETVHKDNICHLVFAPLRVPGANVAQRARDIAEAAVKTFEGAGVFGVEMFLMQDGNLPSPIRIAPSSKSLSRIHLHKRDCTSAPQLRSLYHRGVCHVAIRESPQGYPRSSPRDHRAHPSCHLVMHA